MCVSATATPSAASAGRGASRSRSSRATTAPTCALGAAPAPVTVFFTVPRLLGREQHDAAGVTEHQRGADVAVIEGVFEGEGGGMVAVDEGDDLGVQLGEAAR